MPLSNQGCTEQQQQTFTIHEEDCHIPESQDSDAESIIPYAMVNIHNITTECEEEEYQVIPMGTLDPNYEHTYVNTS